MLVSIRGGNGTSVTQGTLSLADGAANTLTINSATGGATVLALTSNGGGANTSNLVMEVGSTTDKIVLGAGLRATVGGGGVNLNIVGRGNLTGVTQDLLVAPGNTAVFTGGNFILSTSGNFSGYTVGLDLSTIGRVKLVQTPTFINPTLATAYWKGDETGSGITGVWNAFTGGNLNNTNWDTDASSGLDAHYFPGASTDVFFSANSSANTATTLGADFSIKSLTFTNAGGAASIGGANTLTIGTGGITVNSGAAAPTISTPLVIGSAQTWQNDSANDLTVSGAVTTTTGITKAGNGALVLSGNNSTFTGGLTINGGAVRVSNGGALNSGTPQAVTFGAGATSAAKLQANGNSFTIGGLATNATPGAPIVENANAAAATLTVSQTANSTFAGLIQNGTGGGALSIVKAGSGTLTLTGGNTYTGTTAVNNGLLLVNGNQTSANGSVSVQTTGALGGTGTVGGAITINSGGRITGGDLTSIGTLTLSSGLSIAAGGIGYFNITNGGSNDLLSIGGTLSIATGGIIRVSPGLTSAGIYNLATYTGANPTLPGVAIFQDLGGNALPGNYAFSATGGILRLTVSAASYASPSITITTPIGGTRVMSNQNVALTGVAGNMGNLTLNATLADNGGDLVVSGFSPATPTLVAGASTGYTASIATGSTLGTRSFSVKSTGSPSDPAVAAVTSSLSVLGNRTVTAPASPINLGVLHVNNTVPLAGGFSLTSTQLDSEYTRVTVPNGTNGSVTISGGNPGTAFNGSNSDTRAITGTFATAGTKSGSVVLNTVGEGLVGEVVNNVTVGYTASVFSGQAKYADIGAAGSWGTAANWDDLDVLNIGGDGAPGLDGAVSIGDKATFADVGGPAAVTVNLDGVSPSLAGITLSGVTTAYNIATGTGGTITLQNAATPINATGNSGHRISTVLTGSGGLQKTGAANLQLDNGNTYTGATAVTNGVLVLNATNALPTTTVVTLGDGATSSGKIQIGTAASSRLQTIAGLNVSGIGTANRVVGGNSTASTLTVNVAANTVNTYTGFLGGPGTNENSLALTKSGQGTLALTQAPTYTGTTTISLGVLQTANASDLAGYVNIVGGGSAAASAVWQTQGTITKTLGTAVGNIRLVGGTGFSAVGGPLTVTLNGGAQVQHNAGNFLDNAGFVLGSTTSDNQVNFTNAINLNTGDGFQRVFYVEKSLVSSNASALLSGVLSSGTNLTGFSKQGGGTLYLSALNQFGGQLTVVDGFLVAQNNSPVGGFGAFGSGAINSTINVGAGNTPVSTGVGIYISGGDFTVARPFNVVAQTNNPNLAVIFGGLTNNVMAFTGNIATAQNLKITQVATTGGNGLTLSGAITTASGTEKTVTFDNVGAVLYSGVASGLNIALAKTNTGTTTLTGNNSYSGTTTISNGVLQVGNGGTTGTLGSGAVTDNASLVFNRSDTLSVANAISGTGSVTNNGGAANVLNLNGTQSYATLNANSGTTNVNSSFTAPATVNANGGSLTFSTSQTLTALNIGAGATVTFQDLPSFADFGGPTTAAVPEPGTMGLLVVGALGMLARRRRKA
jgi:autotransporter-associated beta strand protein